MTNRRGTLLATDLSDHLSLYKRGDAVRYALGSGEIVGIIREVDEKINKILVAWGGGSLKQHDPEEILPARALQQKFASRRGTIATDESDDPQYVGDGKLHGLDKPRGGGFSIMQELQEDLREESEEEADENPKVALLDTKLVNMPSGARILKDDVYHPTTGEMGTLVKLRGNKVVWFSDYGKQRDVPTAWEREFRRSHVAVNRVGRSILEAQIPLAASNIGKKPGKIVKRVGPAKDGGTFVVAERDTSGPGSQDGFMMFVIDGSGKITKDWGSHPSAKGAEKFYKNRVASHETDISKLKSRRAMYWGGPDRVYRVTRKEQEAGHGVCPKCKGDMTRENFTKNEKLWMCGDCGFKVSTGKLTNQKVHIEIEPDGEVEVTVD